MSEETIKFNNVILNKKEFHKSKEPIGLFSVAVDQIFVSYKFKYNNENFKDFLVTEKVKLFNQYALFFLK